MVDEAGGEVVKVERGEEAGNVVAAVKEFKGIGIEVFDGLGRGGDEADGREGSIGGGGSVGEFQGLTDAFKNEATVATVGDAHLEKVGIEEELGGGGVHLVMLEEGNVLGEVERHEPFRDSGILERSEMSGTG
jgi:hypothetical protein